MFWPIVACVLLPWLLVYLGLHVVQRGIIFIDIAMAQMASLGICVAVLLHLEPGKTGARSSSRSGSLCSGAAIFSVTGKRASQIPQEAVIGIATSSRRRRGLAPEPRRGRRRGNQEHARRQHPARYAPIEVWKCFGLFRRRRRCPLRAAPNRSCSSPSIATPPTNEGLRVRWWDFLFYALFGLVVTSFVRDRRRAARFQLPDCAGGLRDQSRAGRSASVSSLAGSSRSSAESPGCFSPSAGTSHPARRLSAPSARC